MKWATEHKISTKSPLTDELEVEPCVWIWVIVVNADKEVTSDHISFSALASSYVWQHVKSEVNDPTWQRVPDRSHDETVMWCWAVNQTQQFGGFCDGKPFFFCLCCNNCTCLTAVFLSFSERAEETVQSYCLLNPWGKVLSSGEDESLSQPSLAALKVAVPRCRTQQLRSLFFGKTRLETKLLTPDSVLDLILSSERLFWLSLLPSWTL